MEVDSLAWIGMITHLLANPVEVNSETRTKASVVAAKLAAFYIT